MFGVFRIFSPSTSLSYLLVMILVAFEPVEVFAQPDGYEGYQVLRIKVSDSSDRQWIEQLQLANDGVQIWSDEVGREFVDVRVSPSVKNERTFGDLSYTVLIEDLQVHIDQLYASGPHDGFFSAARSYEQHVQFMGELAAAFPQLVDVFSIGNSVEGRPLWVMRISGSSSEKPGMMYHGAQHGNETVGAAIVAFLANHLLTNYETDPEIASLVNNLEWFLLPIMNPDGYNRFSRYNSRGVDLNRNWGGIGGPANAFSEPETAAMRDLFVARPNIRAHIDFHGYVSWILWPWGHTATHTEDHEIFAHLGRRFRYLVGPPYSDAYKIGTIWDVAYPVIGGSTNYTYGTHGIWAFTFEAPSSSLPEMCNVFLSPMLFFPRWILKCGDDWLARADRDPLLGFTDWNENDIPDVCEGKGDLDGDGNIRSNDFSLWAGCSNGPSRPYLGAQCRLLDFNDDNDIDLADYRVFALSFGDGH